MVEIRAGPETVLFLCDKSKEAETSMTEAIIVALLSLAGTLIGSYLSSRKSAVLVAYRLEQLEKKVQAHNNLVERTYRLEERVELHEEKIKVANHRIEDMEKGHD